MNINRDSMNSLLKLTLTLSISLGIVTSVLAEKKVTESSITGTNTARPQPTTDVSESKVQVEKKDTLNLDTDQPQSNPQSVNQTEDKIDINNNPTIPIDNQSLDSRTQPQKIISEDLRESQKNITIKDILLFINLPILTTLFLLWFLNQKKQQEQFDILTKNQKEILRNFNQLSEITNKSNNLDKIKREIIERIKKNNEEIIDSEKRLKELISQQQFNQPANYYNNLTPDTSHSNSNVILDKISQLIETYNQDKTFLSDKAIATVAETKESLNQRRSGSIDTVTLENTHQNKYCIIEEDNDYYLIPHAKIKIGEYNTETLESLFDCISFSSDNRDFKLVKPAKVSKNSSGFWQLKEKGKLDFSSKVYD